MLSSRDGVGTAEDSDEAGVISNARRGVGRKIWGCSMVDVVGEMIGVMGLWYINTCGRPGLSSSLFNSCLRVAL